jgi:transposase
VGRKRQRAAAWARTMAVFAAIPQGVRFGGRFVRRWTALAFVLIIGTPQRLGSGKSIASYLGLVPSEESSGDRRRLGHITKQGNSLSRFLLVEAPKSRSVATRNGGGSFSIWPCGGDGRLPRSPWLVDWRFVSTGCGARDGITSR